MQLGEQAFAKAPIGNTSGAYGIRHWMWLFRSPRRWAPQWTSCGREKEREDDEIHYCIAGAAVAGRAGVYSAGASSAGGHGARPMGALLLGLGGRDVAAMAGRRVELERRMRSE